MRQPTPYPTPAAWVRKVNLSVPLSIVAPLLISFFAGQHAQQCQDTALGITGAWVALFGLVAVVNPFMISAYFERRTMLGPVTPQNTRGSWLLGFRLIGLFLLLVGAAVITAAYALLFLPPAPR